MGAPEEESNPLLTSQNEINDAKKAATSTMPAEAVKKSPAMEYQGVATHEWAADGVPIGHGSVVGEPMPMHQRPQWDSSLFSCLGRNDEFCSSDLEVCLLGSVAPCVLYGSNVERLGSAPGTFANHCLPYSGLYVLGNSCFGGNVIAPWFSYPSRTAIRRKLNLEGTCESLTRTCGCCVNLVADEVQHEQCESACDFATHIFCHPCALCQEGRELRRRLPHPGFNARQVFIMIPPGEQTMGRGAN
ncbi:hypothetical protein LguiA_032271 [Lonicera macranthoides]